MSVTYIIQFDVKSDKKSEFLNIMTGVKVDLPQVEGCNGVVIHAADDDSGYTMVETWESKEAHQTHVEGLVSSGAWESIASHLSQEPIRGYYTVV